MAAQLGPGAHAEDPLRTLVIQKLKECHLENDAEHHADLLIRYGAVKYEHDVEDLSIFTVDDFKSFEFEEGRARKLFNYLHQGAHVAPGLGAVNEGGMEADQSYQTFAAACDVQFDDDSSTLPFDLSLIHI
eukprot:TRINITY_DN736_c0_g1_i5.p1 TRINITY_DN736_c0_g1~~TRINITY_DN736_c0_g1_i5.p1  ORF type:complete len:131 (+),score=38.02 TRINITY_DN736_c0_g1_i5:253-645(+)